MTVKKKNDHIHALILAHARKNYTQIEKNRDELKKKKQTRNDDKMTEERKKADITKSIRLWVFNQMATKQQHTEKKLSISNEISDCHRSSTWLSLFYVVISALCTRALCGYMAICLIIVFIVSQFSELTHTNQIFLLSLSLLLKPVSLPWTYSTESAYWHQLCCTVRCCCCCCWCCLADALDGDNDDEARL